MGTSVALPLLLSLQLVTFAVWALVRRMLRVRLNNKQEK